MSFFSPDMEAMVDVYQSETIELIEELDKYLLIAENENKLDSKAINGVFRIVHSIKSSSAMMGMEEMSVCTNRMEDLFLLFRDDPALINGNETHTFDLMYAYSDYVKSEIQRITEQDFKPITVEQLMKQINKELSYYRNGQRDEHEKLHEFSVPEDIYKDKNDIDISERTWKVFFKKDCQMENVRAYMLINQIKPLCESLSYIPSDLEKKDADLFIKEHGLLIDISSKAPDEVLKKLTQFVYVG